MLPHAVRGASLPETVYVDTLSLSLSATTGGAAEPVLCDCSMDISRFPEKNQEDPLFRKKQEEAELLCGAARPTGIVAELEGALLRSREAFPYFFLVALEAGSLLRAIVLLLSYPLAWSLERLAGWDGSAVRLLLFVACSGLRLQDVESVGRAVLPRFFAQDVRSRVWQAFSSFGGRRFVVSEWPRVMVETFARNQLGADEVIAAELYVTQSGRCLGFPKPRRRVVASDKLPQLLISTAPPPDNKERRDCLGDLHVISVFNKDSEEVVSIGDLEKPVIFHDGRFVQRPTPTVALLVLLWMPVGFVLSVMRVMICSRAPFRWWAAATRLFGIRIVVKGKLPPKSGSGNGLLMVCCHRTLLDPIIISVALARPVTAVTYSVSRLSELLSPIKTVRLERDAQADLRKLRDLVAQGHDVVVCPEGTTSREAFLLRFSALFAEVTDNIVPVAIRANVSIFHGSTSRGFKAMDPFFFFMNPSPSYELLFLDQLPPEMTCGAGGKSRDQVANHVQHLIAKTLGFRGTSFTRRDKYRFLAGNDGFVAPKALF